MAQTALQLITKALRLINANAADEPLDVGQANDALDVFNDMVDAWNADRLSIYTTKSQDFDLVLGKQVYTLGPGGDFDAPRPAQIDGMSSILLYNPEVPVEVPIVMVTVDQWQTQYPVKNVQSSFPTVCYDDGSFPLRSLSMWPIPTEQPGNRIRIYSWQALDQPATLQTSVTFPPAYAEAFKYNLAIRLAPEYQAPLRPEVAAIAADSLAKLKTMNAPELLLTSDLLPAPDGANYRAYLFGIGF